MAIFFPHDRFEEFKHHSERTVARALQATLPDRTRVYHGHLSLRSVPNYGRPGSHLREGESDFILLDPDHGLLLIEIKGGPVEYDEESGRWFYNRNGRQDPMDRNPVEQARENMHALIDRMLDGPFKGLAGLPCTYGYALVFPDHNIVGAPPGADSSIVLSARDLPQLGPKLLQALARWRVGSSTGPLPPNVWRQICEGINGGFRLIEALSSRLGAQEETLVRLTGEQERSLAGLYSNPRVLVKGTAGSGKTMLAMARSRRFAMQGKDTLFLCYNRRLADWLQTQISEELRPLLNVNTFNGLCSEFCQEAKLKFRPPSEQDPVARRSFFEVTAPNLLDHALNIVPRRYDAIVVDEAQDFRPHWWTPIELLNAQVEDGPFYIFYDPEQNLYLDEDPEVPDLKVSYELTANCRNTRKIGALCGKILGRELLLREDAPEGLDPIEEVLPVKAARRERCIHQVRDWLNKGLQPRQIAILSPWTQANSCLDGLTSVGGIALTTMLEAWQLGTGVLFSTIRAFKGLEADALIITDLKSVHMHQQRSELYVAASRAKHLLHLYYSEAKGF